MFDDNDIYLSYLLFIIVIISITIFEQKLLFINEKKSPTLMGKALIKYSIKTQSSGSYCVCFFQFIIL